MNEINDILKKRENILRDTLKSQKAYWIMLENDNLQQISDMFQSTNLSIKKLGELDFFLQEVQKTSPKEVKKTIQEELGKQTETLNKIMEQEKDIFHSLKQKKIKISESLDKNRKEINFTKAYSQNIPRSGFNRLDKKI